MAATIELKGLSRTKRRLIFGFSLLLFIVAVPVSVFYAIGYRFDFSDKLDSIKSVGGMYVRNDVQNTEMFIDDTPVKDMRIFQKAAYIQNLEEGMHRIHVQGALVQTWVKELPVYAHFVTELASFNLPKVPQIRIITQLNDTATGKGVVFENATSTVFSFASTTNQLRLATTSKKVVKTNTFATSTEYVYIKSLFASSTQEKVLLQQLKNPIKKTSFDVATTDARAIIATTTKTWRNFKLYEQGSDVYISWQGDAQSVPYYYCVEHFSPEKTALEYGTHVYKALIEQFASTTKPSDFEEQRVCRDSIRIDNENKKVLWFDFYPDSTDIILMLLDDGLYAVEVDDRAWQNIQPIYPGKNIDVIQNGGSIYVHDGKYFVEVFTEVQVPQ
jgi:hypothetical protein